MTSQSLRKWQNRSGQKVPMLACLKKVWAIDLKICTVLITNYQEFQKTFLYKLNNYASIKRKPLRAINNKLMTRSLRKALMDRSLSKTL